MEIYSLYSALRPVSIYYKSSTYSLVTLIIYKSSTYSLVTLIIYKYIYIMTFFYITQAIFYETINAKNFKTVKTTRGRLKYIKPNFYMLSK